MQFFNAALGKQIDVRHLPNRLRELNTANLLDDGTLIPKRRNIPNLTSQRFSTPAHYQLDDDGVWFAKGGTDYDSVTKKHIYWIGLFERNQQTPHRAYVRHNWTPTVVTVSRNGKVAASSDLLGGIHVWDTATANRLRLIDTRRFERVSAIRWTSDHTLQFGIDFHGPNDFQLNRMGPLTHRFNLSSRKIEKLVAPLAPPAYYQGKQNATLRLTREIEGTMQTHTFLAYDADDTKAYYSRPDIGEIKSFQFLRGVPESVVPVAVGFDTGALLIVDFGQTYPTTINEKRINWPKFLATLSGHDSVVSGIQQSPNGELLASSSTDGTIRFWDTTKLRPVPDIGLNTYERGNTVLEVSEVAKKAGALVGDRIMTVDGISYYESRQRIVDRIYPLHKKLNVGIERDVNGRRQAQTLVIPTTLQTAIVQPLLSFLMTNTSDSNTETGEWILWSPKGFYDSSVEGDKYVRWHRNISRTEPAESDSVDAYASLMRSREIIDELLATKDVPQAIANLRERFKTDIVRIENPVEELQTILKPSLHLVTPVPIETNQAKLATRLQVTINSDNPDGAPVFVRMKRNGQVLSNWARHQVTIPANTDQVHVDLSLDVDRGPNEFEIVAWSESDVESEPLQFSVSSAAESGVRKPKLVILCIGISQYDDDTIVDLDYADADAISVEKALLRQRDGDRYSDVVSYDKPLTNENATDRNVRLGLDWFAANMTELDFGFFFFAGHGIKFRGDYYLLPNDYVSGKPSTALDFEYVSKQLQKCPGRIIVALDACRSGATSQKTRDANRDIEQAARQLTSRKNDLITMVSCQPFEESVEDEKWKHGAFGLALEESLLDCRLFPQRQPGVVDINTKNQWITVNEMRSYIADRVNALTEGRQKPVVWPKLIDADLNLAIAEVLAED